MVTDPVVTLGGTWGIVKGATHLRRDIFKTFYVDN